MRQAALRVALVALLAPAVYYRLVRHDALAYYLLFAGWIVILAVYVHRQQKFDRQDRRKALKGPERMHNGIGGDRQDAQRSGTRRV